MFGLLTGFILMGIMLWRVYINSMLGLYIDVRQIYFGIGAFLLGALGPYLRVKLYNMIGI
jgi:hypothetical protein